MGEQAHGSTGASAGLLLELAVPPAGGAHEFTDWYDTVRSPWRLSSPAVQGGGTYQQVGAPDEWLGCYELSSLSGIELEVGRDLPENQGLMTARLPRFEQRLYETIPVPEVAEGPSGTEAKYLLVVWWTPLPAAEGDFHAWYDEEHIGLLMRVPGWLSIRRYRLVAGTGPAFVALHFLASEQALGSPEQRRAGDTPWRAEAAALRVQHERRLYQLRHRF